MPTFPKAGRFPPASTPKLRRPFQSVMNTSGSCETPPSLINLAREMKRESSNVLLDNSTPTTSPRTSAGHTPHPRAMSFNLNEAQVQIFSHQILIYSKKPKRESNSLRSGERFWMRDCVSEMKGYWVWHVSWRYLKIITENFSKIVYEFGDNQNMYSQYNKFWIEFGWLYYTIVVNLGVRVLLHGEEFIR